MTATAPARLARLADVPQSLAAKGLVPTSDGAGAFVWGSPRDLGDNGVDEYLEQRRTSEVSTCPSLLATSTSILTSGTVYTSPCVCRTAGVYTRARFVTNIAATALTDCKVGVWDSNAAGTILATSGQVLLATWAGGVEIIVSLGAGVTLTRGQVVYLGLGTVGLVAGTIKVGSGSVFVANTAKNGDGTSRISAGPLAGMQLSRTLTGWAGGALPNTPVVGSGTSAIVPWVELLP